MSIERHTDSHGRKRMTWNVQSQDGDEIGTSHRIEPLLSQRPAVLRRPCHGNRRVSHFNYPPRGRAAQAGGMENGLGGRTSPGGRRRTANSRQFAVCNQLTPPSSALGPPPARRCLDFQRHREGGGQALRRRDHGPAGRFDKLIGVHETCLDGRAAGVNESGPPRDLAIRQRLAKLPDAVVAHPSLEMQFAKLSRAQHASSRSPSANSREAPNPSTSQDSPATPPRSRQGEYLVLAHDSLRTRTRRTQVSPTNRRSLASV